MKATKKFMWQPKRLRQSGVLDGAAIDGDAPLITLGHDLMQWHRRTKKDEVGEWRVLP